MGKSCAIDLRVAGSNPAGQLMIYFHNVFPVLTKTLTTFKSSSQVPHQSFRAQTAALFTPAFGPLPQHMLNYIPHRIVFWSNELREMLPQNSS